MNSNAHSVVRSMAISKIYVLTNFLRVQETVLMIKMHLFKKIKLLYTHLRFGYIREHVNIVGGHGSARIPSKPRTILETVKNVSIFPQYGAK